MPVPESGINARDQVAMTESVTDSMTALAPPSAS
jgi:hypothetical protein